VPRPRGAHLFIRGKFAPRRLASRLGEGHFFFVGEMHHRLLISGQLQNEARNIVLFIGGSARTGSTV
jgi:hypothetical protein